MTEQLMAKASLISIMMILTLSLLGSSYSVEPVKHPVLVNTDKTSYKMGDAITISGHVTDPSSGKVILKIFDSKADLVWLFVVTLNKDDSFRTSLPLSNPDWERSTFYVLTAKAGDAIDSTSFEVSGASASPYPLPAFAVSNVGKFLNQSVYLLSIAVVIFAGIVLGIFYSRRMPKSIATLRNEQFPLISFGTPSPAKVYLTQGSSVSFDSWSKIPDDQRSQVDSIEFWIEIKNIGGNAAKNTKVSFLERNELFSRHDLEEEEKRPSCQVLLPELAPGHSCYWDFKISLDRFTRLEKENLFVGLSSSYDKNKTKSYSGIIFGMGKGGNYVVDEWFSH